MINILASSVIGSIVAKIFLSIGLGFVTYKGFDTVLNYVKQYMFTAFETLPYATLQIMGLLGIDQFISLLFSAWSTVFLVKSFKTLRWL